MTLATERYVAEGGWAYLPPTEVRRLRGGGTAPSCARCFAQIQRLNPGVVDSVTKAEEVLNRLIRVQPNIEGNFSSSIRLLPASAYPLAKGRKKDRPGFRRPAANPGILAGLAWARTLRLWDGRGL